MEGARSGDTLTTHKDAVWSCDDTYHANLNALGRRTRAARDSPHALCAGFEALARKHLEDGPPVATCFCDTALCAAARGSASLVINDQAYPGIYLTRETIGLMALEPLQALALKAKRIYTERELSAGVTLTPLTVNTRLSGVLSGGAINDVFKKQSGGTATRRTLYNLHLEGKLQFADSTLDVVMRGGQVVVTLADGSEYDFHQPDPLLDLEPHQIAVVHIEDGGASNSGVCRVLASVKIPETEESCFSYGFRI